MPEMRLISLVWDGTATPEQLSDKGRLSIVVIVGIVLALVSVAVQVRPPKSRLLSVSVADGCYIGIGELLIWYFFPDHFLMFGLIAAVLALLFLISDYTKLHRTVPDYLPRIGLSLKPPRKKLFGEPEAGESLRAEKVLPHVTQQSAEPPTPLGSVSVGAAWWKDDPYYSPDDFGSVEQAITVNFRFTNRQPDRRVNLDADLRWTGPPSERQPSGSHGRIAPHRRMQEAGEALSLPVDVAPESTVKGDLAFSPFFESIFPEQKYRYRVLVYDGVNLFLRLTDHISGQTRDIPLDAPVGEDEPAAERTS
jgi:hypothetical protein